MALILNSGQYPFGNTQPAGALLALSALGNSGVVTLPMKQSIYMYGGISMLVNISAGASLTANVQVSNDPLAFSSPGTALWNLHDVLNNLTTSKNSSMVYPVYALRLNVSAWNSGTATLQIGIYDYQT